MSGGLRLAYNTNGLADHRLEDALAFLADCGYDGVALTLDYHHLDPFAPDLPRRIEALRGRLEQMGLAVVIETGARFLLDPRRKHEPTLLSGSGRERRVDFLLRAVRIGAELGAEAVSFWSGAKPPHTEPEAAWRRLVEGCAAVVEAAQREGVRLGFEPEPAHLVDTLELYERLSGELGHPEHFGLTLDVGHCVCVGEEPVGEYIVRYGERIANVHIEDMRRGVHEHLLFGEGEVDFESAVGALAELGYGGLVCVELSRHSHAAHHCVPHSIEFLRASLRKAQKKEKKKRGGVSCA